MSSYDELVDKWSKVKSKSGMYIFPGDEFLTENKEYIRKDAPDNRNDFLNHYYNPKLSKELQLYLIPTPYVGNIHDAKIFILTLNPGLKPMDYFAEVEKEKKDKEYIEALKNNLLQNGKNKDFPFIFLNPKFYWHSGFDYWHKRFHRIGIIEKIMKEKGISKYTEALSYLSKRVAVLQLVPYHSKSFGLPDKIIDTKSNEYLKSTDYIVKYAQEELKKRANKGEILMIVMRRPENWGFKVGDKKAKNIVAYKSRGGWLKKAEKNILDFWESKINKEV